jgi:MSHA biogenesis protein MshQ
MIGTLSGTPIATDPNGCVGGLGGQAMDVSGDPFPLATNTNAVRFAAGKVTVGQLFVVHISLKLLNNMPTAGLINNSEVAGGDSSRDPGSTGHGGIQWHYFCPAVAIGNSKLLLVKTLVGACVPVSPATTCTPQPITSGVVPNVAKLTLQYSVQYLNTGTAALSSLGISDVLATGAAYVSSSFSQISGTVFPNAPTGTTTLTFAPTTNATLAAGAGGKIQYSVNFPTKPGDAVALINTATMKSNAATVSSSSIATSSTSANLWITKTTSTPSVAPGDSVTYTITIPNNGATAASSIVVSDFLPGPSPAVGATASDRFSFVSLTSAKITTPAGVTTSVTSTVGVGDVVAAIAPYTGANREQVTFTLPSATTIPANGGYLTIVFQAKAGGNVPASTTPYKNDANVYYAGGPVTTMVSDALGTAPVTVTSPMSLKKILYCVYSGAPSTCGKYSGGTIPPGSKVEYELDYTNISTGSLSSVTLTDILPTNTNYVAGSFTSVSGTTPASAPTGTATLTFPAMATLAAGASGVIRYDVQLCAAVGTNCTAAVTSGSNITNTAKIAASTFPAGILASVTTSVMNQANLSISKTASPASIQIGGTTTYTITVTNQGSAVASGIQIYDELPYTSAGYFSFKSFTTTTVGSGYATPVAPNANSSATTLATVVSTKSNPPTFAGYTGNSQQEILWTFPAAQVLAPGDSFTLQYTATAGAALAAGSYPSDVYAIYISSTNAMQSTALATAPVMIAAVPFALYHMDEFGWSGTAGQVADSSGNGYNAKAINGATTASTNPLAAIQGNPGTCNYGMMTGGTAPTVTNGYVQTPLPHLTTDFTVAAWIYPTNVNYVGSRIFVDDTGSSGYGFSIDNGAGNLRLYDRGVSPVILDSTYTLANNTWYFVAAVADITNKIRYIYVFNSAGVLLNTTSDAAPFTGTWTTDAGTVNIGNSEAYYFQGNMDEVQVYKSALSPSAVANLATQTHACPIATLDHILIKSSSSGLTCAPNTLTLVACQSADCSLTYSGGVSGTLTATGTPAVKWDGSTGGAAGSGFTIPSGSSTVTKNVQVATAGSVMFGITAPAPVPTTATVCNFGSPSCTFTANTAGFIFSDTTTPGNVYTIPSQVSGIATPTLYLRAVQASTTNAAVCTPAIISQTVSPTMGYICNNPGSCGNPATINATAIASTGTAVSLAFDANGSAPITVRYDDVGQITLNANLTVTPVTGGTAVTLNGSSNSYVVAPDHFGISVITAGSKIPAGSNFVAVVTAYNGLPTPTATLNFGKETPPEGVTLTSTLVSPLTGANPAIGNNVIPGSEFGIGGMVTTDANGVASVNNLTWGEVGNITLTANLTNTSGYLNSGKMATGTSATVGPFIPHHFDTALTAPMTCTGLTFAPACPGNGLVYSGQAFTTQVTARNLAGSTTSNYSGALGFSKAVTLSAVASNGGAAILNTLGSLTANAIIAKADFASGVNTLTLAQPVFTFIPSPTAPTDVFVRAVDGDGVTSQTVGTESGIKVVSGRIKVSNAYGSELLPLSMTATAQFCNAVVAGVCSGWVTSSTDNSTSYSTVANLVASIVPTTGLLAVADISAKVAGIVTLSGGVNTFTLKAPNKTGIADIRLSAPGYLLTDSITGCVPCSLPGRATFGVYKSNSSIIYMRENY